MYKTFFLTLILIVVSGCTSSSSSSGNSGSEEAVVDVTSPSPAKPSIVAAGMKSDPDLTDGDNVPFPVPPVPNPDNAGHDIAYVYNLASNGKDCIWFQSRDNDSNADIGYEQQDEEASVFTYRIKNGKAQVLHDGAVVANEGDRLLLGGSLVKQSTGHLCAPNNPDKVRINIMNKRLSLYPFE